MHQLKEKRMDRAQKQASIETLQQTLQDQTTVLVVHASGLTVAEVTDLRRKMRAANTGLKVMKNTLARRAVEGTKFDGLKTMLKGPTALVYSTDPVAPAKVVADFAKTNDKIKFVGGLLGAQLLDAKSAAALAKLPSLNELRAKIVGILQTPATRIAVVLKEPAGKLARVMAAKGRAS
jgi:large subunit ribosomal protein L10